MQTARQEENNLILSKRICSVCKKDTTIAHPGNRLKDGGYGVPYPMWYTDGKGGRLCKNCYMRNYLRKYPYQINYKGRRVWNKNPARRIGVCNFCTAVLGEINAQMDKLCNRTSLAHVSYHDDNPFKDTIELCNSCHSKYDDTVSYLHKI